MPSSRPFLSFSAAQLAERAADAENDAETLKLIAHELTFRSTASARRLAAQVNELLSSRGQIDPHAQNSAARSGKGTRTDNQRQARPIKERRQPKFPPTEEQSAAISAFETGQDLKISAFAGAGKTSTLVLMADRHEGRGLYLAFNKKISEDAQEDFDRNVDCRTTHSIAARAVRSARSFGRQKMFSAIRAKQLASVMELERKQFDEYLCLEPTQLAYLVLTTIKRFCYSSDPNISLSHIPKSGRLLGAKRQTSALVNQWTFEAAQQIWERMLDKTDELPLGHDGYLKLWALDEPKLAYEFVLLDEAQDTNQVVLDVLSKQNTQIIYVGDRHQQIYEWRGAVNAMTKIQTPHERHLTQSFRFGAVIASAATDILKTLREPKPLFGNPAIESRITQEGQANAILARTNSGVIAATLDAAAHNMRPHIVGGTQELERLVGDVFSLQKGEVGSHPDFFGFKNWSEVVAFSGTEEGADLAPFVNLIEQNGAGRLWAAIKSSIDEESNADVAISTAHKAKGREWKAVSVADDFLPSSAKSRQINDEERRLFYVTITRAKQNLIVDPAILNSYRTGQIQAASDGTYLFKDQAKEQLTLTIGETQAAPTAPGMHIETQTVSLGSSIRDRPPSAKVSSPARAPNPVRSMELRADNRPAEPASRPKKSFWQKLMGR